MNKKKTVKKVKKQPKKVVDISTIPEKWPDGNLIPIWVREMMATGALPMVKQEEPVKASEQPVEEPKQFQEKPGEMTDNEMAERLKEFYYSEAWVAYKKYIGYRISMVTDSLISNDPYKEPTAMARNQGIRLGLIDLEGYIVSLINIGKEPGK